MNTAFNNPRAGVLHDACSLGGPGACTQRSTRVATRTPPPISPWLLRAFSAYSGWYVGRHFHSLRVSRAGGIPNMGGLPLVIYINHASWWDPLICLTLQNAQFSKRRSYAPIDAAAWEKYPFFGKLGFFGVDQHHRRGAAQFLRTAETVMRQPDSILWLTPQGRFADVRERPVRFKPGLGHLPHRIERAAFVPLALEYTHWEERKPEVLARFGPVETAGGRAGFRVIEGMDWTRHFEQQLQATQDALALESQRRVAEDFKVILHGNSGVGFFYDTWRALHAAFTGRAFQRKHGNL